LTNADKHLHFEIQLLAVELSCFENVFDVEILDQIGGAHLQIFKLPKVQLEKFPVSPFGHNALNQ